MGTELITLKEAARRYDIDYQMLVRRVRTGIIPGFKMTFNRRSIYVRPADVEASLAPTPLQPSSRQAA